MGEKQISLEVVNSNAAGIDIGSRSHWVAVGQNAEDVKEFGVYSQDQLDLCDWLKSKNVTSIAMESTGTYWQNLFSTLVGQGFDVILVNGRQTKNIKGKKNRYQRLSVDTKIAFTRTTFCKLFTRFGYRHRKNIFSPQTQPIEQKCILCKAYAKILTLNEYAFGSRGSRHCRTYRFKNY